MEAEQADVHLVLAIIKPLPHLVQQMPFVNAIGDLELSTSRQHGLLLEHKYAAIDNDQPQILVVLLRIHRVPINLAFFAQFCE